MKSLYSLLLFTPLFLLQSASLTAQWIRQYPLAKLEHVTDIALHPDGHGYAVGPDDMVLRLDPGTKRWTLLDAWDSGWSLAAVDYLEDMSGAFAAAGGQGLIITADAGETWNEVPNAPGGIVAIHIISTTDILVVADEGVFRWTNNSWTDLNLPVTSGIDGGYILDAQHIWCFTSGTTPVIYSTANGGGQWNSTTDVERPDVVKFYNAQYGIALDGRTVYNSLDGGLNWTEVSNNAIHNSSYDFTFGASPNVLMAATFNGVATISIDSGLTWTQKDLGLINQRNYSVAAVSDLEFWVGNDLSSIALTTDAGETWIETSGPDRKIMNDVFFLNRNFGFAVGTDGTFLRTTNGGAIWEDISFGETRSFLAVHGLTTNDIWMGANQRIYHSADMGVTWQEKLALLGANFIDVLAVDANIVLACSPSGLILRTDDAGATWDTVFQTSGQVRSLAKIDANRYMATGFNGLILRSPDKGLTWNPLTPPEAGLQYEQTHFIGQEGWLVTSSFKKTMWHTPNAGDTWEPITLPIDRFWDGVYFITPDTGIIVGRSTAEGRVYTTFNGGANWQAGYITDFPMYGVTGLPNPNGTAWIFGYGSDIEILPYCNMLPVIADFQGAPSPCENDTVTYSVSSQDVDLFFWLFPTGWQIIGNPNNDTVDVKVGRNGGVISVTGSNACGFSSPISINAGPSLLPKITNLAGDNSPCEGEIIPYTATQTDVDDFIWTIPGDWAVQGNANLPTIMTQVGAMAGVISVVGTNQCGATAPFNRNVTPDLRPRMYSVTGNATPCMGDTVEYVGVGEYYDEVVWTHPDDWAILGPSNEIAVTMAVGETEGIVTAGGVNPCGTSAIAEIEVLPFFVPDVFLETDSNKVFPNGGGGVAYQWYMDGVPIEGATSDTLVVTVSGNYSVYITFPSGCSTFSNTITAIVTGLFNPPVTAALDVYPVPVNETLNIKGINGEYTYAIFDITGTLLTQQKSFHSAIDVSALSEGSYMLKVQQATNSYVARFVVAK
jgi:photosystem II stability/assembly factor-like uncharacterized protein